LATLLQEVAFISALTRNENSPLLQKMKAIFLVQVQLMNTL